MSADQSIVDHLHEVLAPLGDLKPRRMFGGYGFYLDGVFFALLSDGVLYFKTSPASEPRYTAEGMMPFSYETKSGAHALKSYWRVPERLFDEPDEMAAWAREAVAAAAMATRQKSSLKNPGSKKKGRPKPTGTAASRKPASR